MKDVVFTYKKRFLLSSKSGQSEFVWTNDTSTSVRLQEISKYNRKAVKVWKAITYYGFIDFVFIERPIVHG